MLSFPSKLLELLFSDPEASVACFSGSLTELLMHPRNQKKIAVHFLRTAIVGFLLATFVSPGVAERFKLTKNEAVAVSFICGYAGIRLLATGDKILESKIRKNLDKSS